MAALYRIIHRASGRAVGLYGETGPVENGRRLVLQPIAESDGQRWRMERRGDPVLMRLARDPSKVLNRRTASNWAQVWTYRDTTVTNNDSLIDTRTVPAGTRILLVRLGLYLTKGLSDDFLYWELRREGADGERQFFTIEYAGEAPENTSGYGAAWPLADRGRYPVTSGFRTPARPGHDGIDIAAPLGTPIYAIYGGVVSRVTTEASNPLEGISVRIDHDFGPGMPYRYLRSYYLHMQRAVVRPGERVEKGQLIGYVNNTGDSQGNHLHLGIRYKNTPFTQGGGFYEGVDFIDPLWILG